MNEATNHNKLQPPPDISVKRQGNAYVIFNLSSG